MLLQNAILTCFHNVCLYIQTKKYKHLLNLFYVFHLTSKILPGLLFSKRSKPFNPDRQCHEHDACNCINNLPGTFLYKTKAFICSSMTYGSCLVKRLLVAATFVAKITVECFKVWIFKEVISLRMNLWSVAHFFHQN